MNSGKYLLNFSIGPVQPFIAAARRTRDLWFGSTLLSRLSLAAARAIEAAGGELIFPHPDELRKSEDREPNIANVILAELPAGTLPQEIATKAEISVRAAWKHHADLVWKKYSAIINEQVWESQIDDALEFFAAWVPVQDGNYRTTRDRLGAVMAARKNTRDFRQPTLAPEKRYLEKSPLDGRNETVFRLVRKQKRLPELTEGQRFHLRLKENEFLDAIGLIKRAADRKAFPSVDRIAADPWLRAAGSDKSLKKHLEEIKTACKGTPGVVSIKDPAYTDFPYEGSVVFFNRHGDILRDLKDTTDLELEALRDPLETLVRELGDPNPYLAIIKADGDRMGKAISNITDKDRLRAFSRDLAGFSASVPDIVSAHRGACVYAGGDDVLAFLPIDKCLPCARRLWEEFGNLMSSWKDEDGNSPTLSVGVSIGHFLEPLETLLHFADETEKKAKTGKSRQDDRNGLAIVVRSRGNAPIATREQWQTGSSRTSLDNRIAFWASLFRSGTLSSRFPYELRTMAENYRNWAEEGAASAAIRADALRIFEKKDNRGLNKIEQQDIETRIGQLISGINTPSDLEHFVSEMLIARHIADATPVVRSSLTGKGEEA